MTEFQMDLLGQIEFWAKQLTFNTQHLPHRTEWCIGVVEDRLQMLRESLILEAASPKR